MLLRESVEYYQNHGISYFSFIHSFAIGDVHSAVPHDLALVNKQDKRMKKHQNNRHP